MKLEKPPTFKKKSHEVQYRFNEDAASKLVCYREWCAERDSTRYRKGRRGGRKTHYKQIRIADRSEHGEATVAEYKDNELAEDSDDEKKIFKAEARAGRKKEDSEGKGNG